MNNTSEPTAGSTSCSLRSPEDAEMHNVNAWSEGLLIESQTDSEEGVGLDKVPFNNHMYAISSTVVFSMFTMQYF